MRPLPLGGPSVAGRRLVIAALAGVAGAVGAAYATPWQASVLVGWDVAAAVFLVWVWATVGGLDSEATHDAARQEDPSAATADVVVVGAGIAALVGIGLLLLKAANAQGSTKATLVAVGVLTVVLSWGAVHTVFTLRYARLYYQGAPGGIDFNEKDTPTYLDFAYLAFTIGMTFQVSDTDLTTKPVRRMALRHALISYLFGAMILGLTINVVGNLLH